MKIKHIKFEKYYYPILFTYLIKRLKENRVECGYFLNCSAKLTPAIMSKTNAVYLRSKLKTDHLDNCPFHDLAELKRKLIKNKTLNFLIKDLPKRTRNIEEDNINKLISSKYKGIYLKLAELFNLLKNDPELAFLKERSFIDPDNCEYWYENSHEITNNAVLLTGLLNRKFVSCDMLDELNKCYSSYDCHCNHPVRDFKLEIIENDIEFHISVSEEIYNSIILNPLETAISKKSYHILAKINEMNKSHLENKRFFTKNSKKVNHVIKNKKFVELIEENLELKKSDIE